ncbi:hypothetical protein Snoj_25910 [Streptomyces nojiriensis]|uniref:Uncharacterized protein n=1 Tax=Streptomyces nojiriensis TaxID=66374 RepID=A0ABQ3SKK5_9ACTN|nr:hypothetical protein GCM10010205_69510 [Streptomyces nojiriensis]GHI68673.1 hypothetical protein Snoj_25910 [Streptomyces nojiriensis]
MHAEPMRAQTAAVEEREQQARPHTNAKLFGQLPRGGLLIRLTDTNGPTDYDLMELGKARQPLRPSGNDDPPTCITTHRHGDSVQPTFPNCLPTADHAQDTILIIDTLHQFVHDGHPGMAH